MSRSRGSRAAPRSSKADDAALRAFACAIVAPVALAGCAQYAGVKPKRAVLQGPPGSEPLASAERKIERARKAVHSKPLDALGDCVETV
jgi:hypothetical protein